MTKTYLVGGAVRDGLLGIPVSDLDYVVTGTSVAEMLKAGYSQVGKDFPVFLHPVDGAEYALARTEKKTGKGHTDFTTETDGVTIEQDLQRRDLTINAMARDLKNVELVDPYNGERDLKNKVLRHVNTEAFREDPLRVLRVARFLAKFSDFVVDPETQKLCKQMVAEGELDHLTPERVALEMMKALECVKPSRFFVFLQMVGALKVLFPELYMLTLSPAGAYQWHPEGTSFQHTMLVLDQATKHTSLTGPSELKVLIRFCALTHDLGKGVTPPENWPKHYGHEAMGVPLVKEMCERLKLTNKMRDYACVVAKFHTHVHNVYKLKPSTVVRMSEEMKLKQHGLDLVYVLTQVAEADAKGRSSYFEDVPYMQSHTMACALMETVINARDVCTLEELQNVNILKNKLFMAKVAAVNEVLYTHKARYT